MNISVAKIIRGHNQVSRSKDQPLRLVEIWVDSEPPYTSSLIVTAFDLFSSLFGDCVYSMFSNSEINAPHDSNFFQISIDQYTILTDALSLYLSVKHDRAAPWMGCSLNRAFRDVTSKGLELLSERAYEITVSRGWVVKHRSLDPILNPNTIPNNPELAKKILLYHQTLSPYIINDVIGIILAYSIDLCRPNHLRCSKENKDGTRCNRLRSVPTSSCMDHQQNPYFLSNHYFV